MYVYIYIYGCVSLASISPNMKNKGTKVTCSFFILGWPMRAQLIRAHGGL